MQLIQIDKKQKEEICFRDYANPGKYRTPKIVKQARENIGKFSEPSKLPCYAWSIPAQKCITGSKLAQIDGTVCSDCYALKGFYHMPSTVKAMDRRYSTLDNLKTWQENFVLALQGETYFRWFDSGDLQSLEMLESIDYIARHTPHCKHWLPSKEYKIVSDFLKKHGKFSENLTVRLSAHKIGLQHVPLSTGTASLVLDESAFDQFTDRIVNDENFVKCKAPAQEGKCLDCRACWNQGTAIVIYRQH